MKTTITLSLLMFCFVSIAQNYPIGRLTIALTDASRSNRQIGVEIFYPATSAGNNTPVAGSAGELFPVIAIGHGFSMTFDVYSNFWNEFVPQGYIIILPKTETGPIPFPSHSAFALDLNFCLGHFQTENSNPASLFFQKISDKNAVMGHSMGGGCSFLAAESNPNITTVVGFAPAETNPSAIAAAANAAIPALVFVGSKDAVTAPAGNATAIYNAVPADCKAYVTITDGSHCRFAESSALCEFGESSSCLGCSFISRPQHHSLTFQFLNPWLRFYLKGECDQFDVFQNLLTSVSEVTTEQSCNYSLPVADFSISGMTEFCDGDSVLFSASGSYDFQWSNGDTTSFITIFESGNYQLIVTDYMNCRDTSRSETIVANPPPAPLIEQRGDSLLVTGNFIIQWLLEGDSITGATELSIIPTSVGWYSAMVTDSNGCSGMTDSVQILLTIIKENMPTKQIALYPNPTNGKVYFDDYLKQTKIFNIYGEAVMELNGSEADLSELAQGVYLLKEGERVVRIFKY